MEKRRETDRPGRVARCHLSWCGATRAPQSHDGLLYAIRLVAHSVGNGCRRGYNEAYCRADDWRNHHKLCHGIDRVSRHILPVEKAECWERNENRPCLLYTS